MSELPVVAPHDACIRCFRSDTTTAFGTRGPAEFHIAALMVKLGIPNDQAQKIVEQCEHESGAEPGMVRHGTHEYVWLLCSQCAAETGIEVGIAKEGVLIPTYSP